MSSATSPLDDARHLLQRTGFAAPVIRVLALADTGPSDLIVERLRSGAPIAPLQPPDWVDGPLVAFESFKDLPRPQAAQRRQALRKAERQRLQSLRAWWLSNLVTTDNELGARMTLFWQNHFTSSFRKVRYAQLMYRQQRTLMVHALGSFRALLGALLADPALLLYLDNHRNRRDRPNENLARELLELFALGEGSGYTERDVREVARALTGRGVDADKAYRFRNGQHDASEKTILGERGAFDGDDVVELLLARSGTAEFIVGKLWNAFVSPTLPEPRVRVALGALFRVSDYDC